MQVGILTYPGVSLFELACATELFALPRQEFEDWYTTQIICLENSSIAANVEIKLQATYVSSFANFDLLIIPSWPVTDSSVNEQLNQQILAFHQRGKTILSFCSGAFLLAEAGLLNGRSVTTHWRYADEFKQRFPLANYQEDVLYVLDDDIGCSAGSAAALDLGIEFIRRDKGYEVANAVARRLVLPAHRKGGQKQFVEKPVARRRDSFAATLDWAVEHVNMGINVNTLAKMANMSRRTFDRKFRQSFNMSAKQWMIERQIENAKRLLEDQQLTVEQVAEKAGFDNAVTMRHHFRNTVNTSPSRYREQFKSKSENC